LQNWQFLQNLQKDQSVHNNVVNYMPSLKWLYVLINKDLVPSSGSLTSINEIPLENEV
jgi:hypothetical protein